MGCPEDLVWKGSVWVAVIDRTKGIDEFRKAESVHHCLKDMTHPGQAEPFSEVTSHWQVMILLGVKLSQSISF